MMSACFDFTGSAGESRLCGGGQNIVHPLVDRARFGACSLSYQTVMLRRCAKSQLAGIGFLRGKAVFRGPVEVIINAVMEGFWQFFGGFGLKCNDISDPKDVAMEQKGVFVKRNNSLISFVSFQGFIPASVRNRRVERTAALIMIGFGWGVWNVMFRPFNFMRTLEPEPCLISAPRARNRFSMSTQRMSERVGVSKIARNVRMFLEETMNWNPFTNFYFVHFHFSVCFGSNIVSVYDIVKRIRND